MWTPALTLWSYSHAIARSSQDVCGVIADISSEACGLPGVSGTDFTGAAPQEDLVLHPHMMALFVLMPNQNLISWNETVCTPLVPVVVLEVLCHCVFSRISNVHNMCHCVFSRISNVQNNLH